LVNHTIYKKKAIIYNVKQHPLLYPPTHNLFSLPICKVGKMKTTMKNKDVIEKNIKILYKQKDGRVREYNIALLYFLTK